MSTPTPPLDPRQDVDDHGAEPVRGPVGSDGAVDSTRSIGSDRMPTRSAIDGEVSDRTAVIERSSDRLVPVDGPSTTIRAAHAAPDLLPTADPDTSSARPYGDVVGDLGVDRASVTAREQDRYGGVKIGAAFFGFMTAIGIAALLSALLAGTGVAIGLANHTTAADINNQAANATGTARTIGLIGAIALLVVLALAYYSGGYVAGRMARFQGTRQGFAVWLWSVVFAVVIALLVLIFGSKVNVLSQLNLPRIPIDEGSLTGAGWIALGAVVLVSLGAALAGGKAGMFFHRRVDKVGLGV